MYKSVSSIASGTPLDSPEGLEETSEDSLQASYLLLMSFSSAGVTTPQCVPALWRSGNFLHGPPCLQLLGSNAARQRAHFSRTIRFPNRVRLKCRVKSDQHPSSQWLQFLTHWIQNWEWDPRNRLSLANKFTFSCSETHPGSSKCTYNVLRSCSSLHSGGQQILSGNKNVKSFSTATPVPAGVLR